MKLFDMDGTLIDSNGVWLQIDLDFLNKRGLSHSNEYSQRMAHSIFPVAARLTKEYYNLPESPEKIMEEWLSMAKDAYANRIPLKLGAKEYLNQCRAEGTLLTLITAGMPELCQLVLERHGLIGYFSHVIYVQNLGLEKNNPKVFEIAAAQLGVREKQCTVYEDSPAACAAAKEAGMHVVGVYDAFYAGFEEEMTGFCDDYLHSFTELLY